MIVSTPFKLQYKAGEKLDLTGMQLTIRVEEAEIPVSVDDCIITGFDSERAGDQEIKVVYETEDTIYSAAFTIRVVSATGIGLVTKPAKLYYTYGEALDTTGLSVTVHYSDGSVGYVSEGLEVTGYDALIPGVQRLTVTYQGKATGFSVKVLNN